jgi:hypothetical protein
MSNNTVRLQRGVAALEEALEELEQKRRETNAPRWGYGTELASIAELWDLEDDILCYPDAMEIN